MYDVKLGVVDGMCATDRVMYNLHYVNMFNRALHGMEGVVFTRT